MSIRKRGNKDEDRDCYRGFLRNRGRICKAAGSKREAREFINNGAVLVNGEQQKSLEFVVSKENAIGNKYTVIRRGKKNYYLLKH